MRLEEQINGEAGGGRGNGGAGGGRSMVRLGRQRQW